MYTHFYYIKEGFKGVKIKQVCFRDAHLRQRLPMRTEYMFVILSSIRI